MKVLLLLQATIAFMPLINHHRRTSVYYDGNHRNKNHLREIDYKLQKHRNLMKKLVDQKKNLIKNMTGIELSISSDNFLEQFIHDNEEPQFVIRFEPDSDEPHESKSENFEVFKNTDFTFDKIGGYDLIKDELMQCADMLVHYEKYAPYNVRTPKGIILEGPPGNGKTLLAKCFSGEIKVSFIPVSGAQFQEKYVGVGASRIRELFELASKNTPCIIFIDELDALCRKRSDDSHHEHDSTLNELLVNMDGFKNVKGIFIIGATNRADLLDAALTRPGRIDKKIYVGNPDRKTQEAILNIHTKGKPMDNVAMEDLLTMSQGFSGAQIENFLNEAMLHALRANRSQMSRDDLEIVANRIHTGYQSVETKISDEHLYQVAIHEMGHVFVALLTKYKKVIKVSINLWSPQCLGFTLFEPPNRALTTKQELMCELMVLLGGRVAEEIFFESGMSSSASRDLEYTKRTAEQMINVLGMGEKTIYPQSSNEYKQLMDKEMDSLIEQSYKRTQKLLLTIKPLLKESAELLVKKRELKVEEIVSLFKKYMERL